MNLSLKDLPDEQWKPIKDFEEQFAISNKGRIKRLNTWTTNKIKTFLNEHIISLRFDVQPKNKAYYFYTLLSHNGKRSRITITRLLYYSFVEEFDLNDKTLIVVNENEPMWDIDVSKLSLNSIHSVFKRKT
ncbi:NUMOD4 domain-containing protein [Chryseobacterium sp. Chry.R1]|uniref:NUMOD4 domain-containing protein n=1 Tax=Chryseobacterium sp. Chry.R1 TaxID=3139392 RepID=UPI0031F92A78